MNKLTQMIVYVALAITTSISHFAIAQSEDAGVLKYPADSARLASLNIEPVSLHARPTGEPLNGRVVYDEDRTSRVNSPLAGRVVKIFHRVGDPVAKNDPLLELDSPELGSAEAEASKADADLVIARAGYQRAQMLYEGHVLAKKDLEQAEGDFHKAEAEVQRTKLRLRNLGIGARSNEEDLSLRTAVDGVVTERHVNPGMEVRPDLPDPLFVVSDPTHVWIYIDLLEKDLSRVTQGQQVEILSDAYPNRPLRGEVRHIGDVMDPNTHRLTATLAVDNPKKLLKPGMYVRVSLLAGEGKPSVVLPNSALITEGQHTYVFVETKPGELHKRMVTVAMQGREQSVVESGLREGERVVTRGALLLNADLQSK